MATASPVLNERLRVLTPVVQMVLAQTGVRGHTLSRDEARTCCVAKTNIGDFDIPDGALDDQFVDYLVMRIARRRSEPQWFHVLQARALYGRDGAA